MFFVSYKTYLHTSVWDTEDELCFTFEYWHDNAIFGSPTLNQPAHTSLPSIQWLKIHVKLPKPWFTAMLAMWVSWWTELQWGLFSCQHIFFFCFTNRSLFICHQGLVY